MPTRRNTGTLRNGFNRLCKNSFLFIFPVTSRKLRCLPVLDALYRRAFLYFFNNTYVFIFFLISVICVCLNRFEKVNSQLSTRTNTHTHTHSLSLSSEYVNCFATRMKSRSEGFLPNSSVLLVDGFVILRQRC